ncbi:MAG: hypothetical protein ACRD0H_01625 [Actinomycetes bacterium]
MTATPEERIPPASFTAASQVGAQGGAGRDLLREDPGHPASPFDHAVGWLRRHRVLLPGLAAYDEAAATTADPEADAS